MENSNVSIPEQKGIALFKNYINQDLIKKSFEQILGKKAPIFISNLTTTVTQNAELQKADYNTIISAALMAAGLDLPILSGLGFAGIIPYWDSKEKKFKAQFQVMKKGYIQLAQRTGLFQTIHSSNVCEGELISYNKFTGEYKFKQDGKTSDKIIGYVSYFKLLNGFEKYFYMDIIELEKHGKKYSKSYQRGKGKWADKEEGGFEQMCEKTVLKLNLSNWAPLSADINMQKAIIYDQAIITEDGDPIYPDNESGKIITEQDKIDKIYNDNEDKDDKKSKDKNPEQKLNFDKK